jgi:hypothetical protein
MIIFTYLKKSNKYVRGFLSSIFSGNSNPEQTSLNFDSCVFLDFIQKLLVSVAGWSKAFIIKLFLLIVEKQGNA